MNSGWSYKVAPPSTGKAAQPTVAAELLRGNADALDRLHPQLGPALLGLSCLLLVFGLWLRWRERRPKGGDDYAGVC